MIEDELRDKPRCGLAIDVQNGLVVARIFNYSTSGSPTFHMGGGNYQGIEARFPLNRYQGGRVLRRSRSQRSFFCGGR